eukprot:snap_masked-scaffold_81-processed-gene-0.34-mRNA-1 protein AED:1.00 eAED:1.00 QI:0/-1/0/0/-1/1/1/0/415
MAENQEEYTYAVTQEQDDDNPTQPEPIPTTRRNVPEDDEPQGNTQSRGVVTRSAGTQDLFPTSTLEELTRQQRERSRLERWEKALEDREEANRTLQETLARQQEANLELQRILEARQKLIEEGDAGKSTADEDVTDTPEHYDNENNGDEVVRHEVPVNDKKRDKESVMSYRSLDPWSDTGSSFVDISAVKDGYMYDWRRQVITDGNASGVPLVQFQLPPKLWELTQKAILNFLHDFDGVAVSVPNLKIQVLLTEDVTSSLRHRGVDVYDTRAIYRYLKKHVSKFDRINRARCLTKLSEELTWPSRTLSPEEQIYLFFDEVHKKLRFLSQGEKDQHRKRIVKILLQKTPQTLHLELDELLLGVKHLNLQRLKQAYMNNKNGLKIITKPRNQKGELTHKPTANRSKKEKYGRIKLVK